MSQALQIADNSHLARKQTTKPLRVTPRVKRAIEAMVYDAADYQTAAATAGISTYRLRVALSKPHVAALLKSEMHVLRAARSPKNFHRLCEIADADNNMPAVNAIKALEQLDAETAMKSGNAQAPGVTIIIASRNDRGEINTISGEQRSRHMIEAEPDGNRDA